MPMSDEHKAALARGRKETRAVKRYLQALGARKPGRPVTPERLKERIAALGGKIAEEADPLKALEMRQSRLDAEAALAKAEATDDMESLEAGFRDLVSHPWFIGGRTLDPKRMHMFYTACYDLDTFRSFVFESSFCDKFEIEPEALEELRTNDEALLRFAFRWLRFAMFAEPTMKVREGAVDRSTT